MLYKVGQVVYAVLRKEPKVIPLQIIEEIIRRSLNGEETTYMVKVGKEAKTAVISKLDAEIFDNADAARAMLIERATQAIILRVDGAVAVAKEWYPSGFEAHSDDALTLLTRRSSNHEQDISKVNKQPNSMVRSEVASLAAEFAAEVSEAETFIDLPDGTKARVNKIKLPDSLQG